MSTMPSSSASGKGSSQIGSPRRVGSGGPDGGSGGGGWRRPLSRSALRQRLVAIRYGHARTGDRSSKPASPRQAAWPGPIALPDHAGVLLASAPPEDGRVPADAAAWLRAA